MSEEAQEPKGDYESRYDTLPPTWEKDHGSRDRIEEEEVVKKAFGLRIPTFAWVPIGYVLVGTGPGGEGDLGIGGEDGGAGWGGGSRELGCWEGWEIKD